MKNIFNLSLILLLSSCTSYRYLSVGSAEIWQDRDHRFEQQNDSLRISYGFYGENGPLNIRLYNKTNEPLYLDLNRSALLVNDQAICLNDHTVQFSGSFINSGLHGSSFGGFAGSAALPRGVLFIPPHSYIEETPLAVTNSFFDSIPPSRFTRSQYWQDPNNPDVIYVAHFQEGESPLHFSTYLSLYYGSSTQPVVMQHHFFVSELVKSAVSPANFDYVKNPHADKFFVSRVRGGGVAGGLILATAVAAAAVSGRGGH